MSIMIYASVPSRPSFQLVRAHFGPDPPLAVSSHTTGAPMPFANVVQVLTTTDWVRFHGPLRMHFFFLSVLTHFQPNLFTFSKN